jgi:hypothetical protein
MSTQDFYIGRESTKGKNTREALTSAKARKGQTRKADAQLRAQAVDSAHSLKLDRSEAQRNTRRAKRAK